MEKGYLSQYFHGVAAKRLSSVEVNPRTSNQHEFNGSKGLKLIFGEPSGKTQYQAKFLYLADDEDECVRESGFVTWYDAREKARIERGVMRWECRLYFSTNQVMHKARTDDVLVIAKGTDGNIFCIVIKSQTTILQQVLYLFNISDLSIREFDAREDFRDGTNNIEFLSQYILESIGVVIAPPENNYLDEMIEKFAGKFPTTREFSGFARKTLSKIDPRDDPDQAILAWMNREEELFRALEQYLISERLEQGFGGDVNEFISFSLSVQNRRKSRVGLAFENHLEHLFNKCDIRYTRAPITEHKSKPDFIFPSIAEYKDELFLQSRLTMLGVKSSCKDRWRQVLSEAARIKTKHLITLEVAISQNQTDEMRSQGVQLILPAELHLTYSNTQQGWLMNVSDFICLLREKQLFTSCSNAQEG